MNWIQEFYRQLKDPYEGAFSKRTVPAGDISLLPPWKHVPFSKKQFDISVPGEWYFPETYSLDPRPADFYSSVVYKAKPSFFKIHQRKIAIGLGATLTAAYLFSGFDDQYNTIEGFNEQGMSSFLRKKNTDFGSGWDPVRTLAKAAGKTFKEFVGTEAFKTALSEAKVVKLLPSGAFGSAEILETKLGKESLRFVRKRVNPKTTAEYREHIDFLKEAAMQEKVQTLGAPSVYRASEKEILMEYIEGQSIESLARKGPIPEGIWKQVEAESYQMAQKGVFHQDIHRGNIIVNQKANRVSIIDYGYAEAIGPTEASFHAAQMEAAISAEAKKVSQFTSGIAHAETALPGGLPHAKTELAVESVIQKPQKAIDDDLDDFMDAFVQSQLEPVVPPQLKTPVAKGKATPLAKGRAKRKLGQSSVSLQKAQEELWSNAISGGKRHLKRTPHVRQLTDRWETKR